MTRKQLASLGKELAKFLVLFVGRFRSRPGFALLSVSVQGLLLSLQRKNIEALALELGTAPRTLQRFVESITWDETGLGDDCQRLVAREHAHPEAIGCVDESGTAKSGSQTAGAARQCLIVARHVLTNEVKYFVANRVPGEQGMALRRLLRVAFGRWSVESCFRQAQEELGLDQYEVRGWRCLHRHFYLTQLTHLFCARLRQKFDAATTHDDPLEHLTTAQVRRALNTWLETAQGRLIKAARFQRELAKQQYYQRRSAQAQRSQVKTRRAQLRSLGIDPDSTKSCTPQSRT